MRDRRNEGGLFNSSIGAGGIQVIIEEDEDVYRDTTKKLAKAQSAPHRSSVFDKIEETDEFSLTASKHLV
jgi:hypothetical protein